MKDSFLFRSTAFEVEAGEDSETNSRRYGRQLARWIKGKFEALGYTVEDVIPEDWGWCVMCQREPFSLWIGCGNRDDSDIAKEDDPPPKKEKIVWECFAMAEVGFLRRIFGKVDTSAALNKLNAELKQLLDNEPSITREDNQ